MSGDKQMDVREVIDVFHECVNTPKNAFKNLKREVTNNVRRSEDNIKNVLKQSEMWTGFICLRIISNEGLL